ncbi:MAG: DUF2101 family protein [Clostridia bacterium]|nr:DUF2101 family protein [Clostridia bacterium]
MGLFVRAVLKKLLRSRQHEFADLGLRGLEYGPLARLGFILGGSDDGVRAGLRLVGVALRHFRYLPLGLLAALLGLCFGVGEQLLLLRLEFFVFFFVFGVLFLKIVVILPALFQKFDYRFIKYERQTAYEYDEIEHVQKDLHHVYVQRSIHSNTPPFP